MKDRRNNKKKTLIRGFLDTVEWLMASSCCCWGAYCCGQSTPLPWTPTETRAVLAVYPLGCSGHRIGLNNFDRNKVFCCFPPYEGSTTSSKTPPQLQGILSDKEFEAIIADTRDVIAKRAPSCPHLCFMTMPILGWYCALLPYIICGVQDLMRGLQSDVVDKHRATCFEQGVTINAGSMTQRDNLALFVAIETVDIGAAEKNNQKIKLRK